MEVEEHPTRDKWPLTIEVMLKETTSVAPQVTCRSDVKSSFNEALRRIMLPSKSTMHQICDFNCTLPKRGHVLSLKCKL